MAKIETLASLSQLSTTLAKNVIVIVDFHATWCGPCKAIAPTFESLAAKHAAPSKVAFTKCDVDAAQEIAAQYSVRAMPTFLIFKNRQEVARVQGADVRGLTTAVEKYAAEAKSAAATFATSGKGYTLGSSSGPPSSSSPSSAAAGAGAGASAAAGAAAKPAYVRDGQFVAGVPLGAQMRGWANAAVVFFGLYFMSLFSLDPVTAAEQSAFNANRKDKGPVAPTIAGMGGPGRMAPGATGRRLGTLDSIRGSGG
ncbi:thioredoxin-like protein [Morchella snyderi]|nr:thioredoxin-like protein [Morchella snyderi]